MLTKVADYLEKGPHTWLLCARHCPILHENKLRILDHRPMLFYRLGAHQSILEYCQLNQNQE